MSKKRKWDDLKESEKKWAKDQYMDYQSIASIAKALNIPRTSLNYHTSKFWDVEREMLRADLYQQFSSTKKAHFVTMSENAMKIIGKSLKHLAERSEPPSTKEAKEATVILESLDKITRLDEGKPTEISEEKVMSFKDISEITDMVPFKNKNKDTEETKKQKDKKEEDEINQ